MSKIDFEDRIRDEIPESYNTDGILFNYLVELLYPSYEAEEYVFENMDTALIPNYNNGELINCNEFIENMWGSLYDVHKHDKESWSHYSNRLVQCANASNNNNITTKLSYLISGMVLGVKNVSISSTQSISGKINCVFDVDYLVDNMSQVIDITVVKAKYQRIVSGLLTKYLPAGILINSVTCGTVTKVLGYS